MCINFNNISFWKVQLTREVSTPLIYRRKDELLSLPCKLSRKHMGEARSRNPSLHHTLGLGFT